MFFSEIIWIETEQAKNLLEFTVKSLMLNNLQNEDRMNSSLRQRKEEWGEKENPKLGAFWSMKF